MKKKRLPVMIFISAGLLFSCYNKSNETGISTKEMHDERLNVNTTTLTTAQMQSIGIEFGIIGKKQLTASLKANGILRVPNQNKANVTAPLGGTVESILVQAGSSVSKGQSIAIISNPAFITLQENYLSAVASSTLAQAEYDRQKILKDGNAASQKTFQQADATLKELLAKKFSLQKQLELIGINTAALLPGNMQSTLKITSPIAGSVSNVMLNIGSFAEANNPIAEIVDNSRLHLDLYVYEQDLQKIKVGQTIHFTLTNNPGKEYDADVYAISNTFEPDTKAIAVHAIVKGNKSGLIDGMNVTALVSLENATVDAVPTGAIISSEGHDYIFIALGKEMPGANESHGNDEMAFEKIPVKKGTTDVGYSEITLLRDIPKESKVVTRGAFFILAKMKDMGDEGHEH